MPGPLYSLDPSERASGSRQTEGELERRGRGNDVCTQRGRTLVAGGIRGKSRSVWFSFVFMYHFGIRAFPLFSLHLLTTDQELASRAS